MDTPSTAIPVASSPVKTASGGEFLHVPSGEGETVWLNGDVYTVKIGTRESGGSLALLKASVPPGGGPPLHTQGNEDEAFYLLDGELEIYAGDTTVHAGPGDFVFIPRNTAHGFRNTGLRPARQLLVFSPGGVERFFTEAGVPAVAGQPVPPFDPADNPRAVVVGARHHSFQV